MWWDYHNCSNGSSSSNISNTSCCDTCAKTPVDSLENHQDSSFYELLDIPEINKTISPEYIYNLLTSGHTEIDDIISRLEKEEIIGKNPIKHWERYKIICKLELKDLNFRIQNKKIESTNENIKK